MLYYGLVERQNQQPEDKIGYGIFWFLELSFIL